MFSPDESPFAQAMDSLDLEFFLEDLKDLSGIVVSSTSPSVHFSARYSSDNNWEIVYKLA